MVKTHLPDWHPLHELEGLHHISGPGQDILEGADRRSQLGVIHLSEEQKKNEEERG